MPVEQAIFLSLNAFGDTLCTTPVIAAFRRASPSAHIVFIAQNAGFCRILDNNPDIDLLLYSDRLYFHGIPDQTADWLRTMPIDLSRGANLYRLDLKIACRTPDSFRRHITHSFARLVGVSAASIIPTVVLTDYERRSAACLINQPFVVFSMHSVCNPDRPDGRGRKKEWPIERWQELANRIVSLYDYEVITIGAESDSPHNLCSVRHLYGLPIRICAALLERASCVVTIENGIAHLCAALAVPTIEIYSNMMPLEWACPVESPTTTILYRDPIEISCDEVLNLLHEAVTVQNSTVDRIGA
ncbi:MAG: glycosyltransferase family 9 protein [Chitinivibrionales bacterium]|nr:glycosyltransferase family 9 protein [Chitinivibrionales bacterium]